MSTVTPSSLPLPLVTINEEKSWSLLEGMKRAIFPFTVLQTKSAAPHIPDMYLSTLTCTLAEDKNAKEEGKVHTRVVREKAPSRCPIGCNTMTWRCVLILLTLAMSLIINFYILPLLSHGWYNCESIQMEDGSLLIKNCAGLKWRIMTDGKGKRFLNFYESFPGQLKGILPKENPSSPHSANQNHHMRKKRSLEDQESTPSPVIKQRNIRDLINALRGSYETAKAKYDNLQQQITTQTSKVESMFTNGMQQQIERKSRSIPEELQNILKNPVHLAETKCMCWRTHSIQDSGNKVIHTKIVAATSSSDSGSTEEAEVDLQEERFKNKSPEITSMEQNQEAEMNVTTPSPIVHKPESPTRYVLEMNNDGNQDATFDNLNISDGSESVDATMSTHEDSLDQYMSSTYLSEAQSHAEDTNTATTTEFSTKISVAQEDQQEVHNEAKEQRTLSEQQMLVELKENDQNTGTNNEEEYSVLPTPIVPTLNIEPTTESVDEEVEEPPTTSQEALPSQYMDISSNTDAPEHKEDNK